MDDTNKSILRLLRDNGRMSFTEIGEELGISRVAVQKRVKKLEEEGIIRYTGKAIEVLNPDELQSLLSD